MTIALIVGGAECVWRDAVRALQLFEPDVVIAIKDQMATWPMRIDYGATLHSDRTDTYMRTRRSRGYPMNNFQIFTDRVRGGQTTPHRITNDWAGSTGLFAVKVGMEQGIDAMVLAGVPMQENAGHYLRKKVWTSARAFQNGWRRHEKDLKPIVRSMSGWTKELFGEPTPEWLSSFNSAPPNPEMVMALQELADGPVESSTRKFG